MNKTTNNVPENSLIRSFSKINFTEVTLFTTLYMFRVSNKIF